MEIRQIYSDHLESNSDEQCETHPEAMPLVGLQHQPINIFIGKNSWRIGSFIQIIWNRTRTNLAKQKHVGSFILMI